jgi:hypothetical protein
MSTIMTPDGPTRADEEQYSMIEERDENIEQLEA